MNNLMVDTIVEKYSVSKLTLIRMFYVLQPINIYKETSFFINAFNACLQLGNTINYAQFKEHNIHMLNT